MARLKSTTTIFFFVIGVARFVEATRAGQNEYKIAKEGREKWDNHRIEQRSERI